MLLLIKAFAGKGTIAHSNNASQNEVKGKGLTLVGGTLTCILDKFDLVLLFLPMNSSSFSSSFSYVCVCFFLFNFQFMQNVCVYMLFENLLGVTANVKWNNV